MIRSIWNVRSWESECGLTDLPSSCRIGHQGGSIRSYLLEALILKLRIQDSAGLRPGWQARARRRIGSVVSRDGTGEESELVALLTAAGILESFAAANRLAIVSFLCGFA
jgi:hypothetical protein